jgi:ribonuclease-3
MDEKRRKTLTELMAHLGLPPGDPGHFDRALTHSSYAYEAGTINNERLEFLGDAVVGLAIGSALYHMYPNVNEGALAKMRAAIISAASLGDQAMRLGLGQYLLLGKSEEQSGGRERQSILADAFEAVVGAIYLTYGWDIAHNWLIDQFKTVLEEASKKQGDFKTELQEILQARGKGVPEYRLLGQTGPDHDRQFTIGAFVKGSLRGTGKGRSKKQAGQEAAKAALNALGEDS